MEHRLGEGDRLGVAEAAEEDRHEERGHLVVRERSVHVGGHEVRDFARREGFAVPLRGEELDKGTFHRGGGGYHCPAVVPKRPQASPPARTASSGV